MLKPIMTNNPMGKQNPFMVLDLSNNVAGELKLAAGVVHARDLPGGGLRWRLDARQQMEARNYGKARHCRAVLPDTQQAVGRCHYRCGGACSSLSGRCN